MLEFLDPDLHKDCIAQITKLQTQLEEAQRQRREFELREQKWIARWLELKALVMKHD